MDTAIFHERDFVVVAHQNNNLFSGWSLCSYVNSGFRLTITPYDFLNVFYFICLEIWKCFFDLENISCVVISPFNALAYNMLWLLVFFDCFVVLKYLEVNFPPIYHWLDSWSAFVYNFLPKNFF